MMLSRVFGHSLEGWLKLQLQFDLWRIQQRVDLKNLKRLKAAQIFNNYERGGEFTGFQGGFRDISL